MTLIVLNLKQQVQQHNTFCLILFFINVLKPCCPSYTLLFAIYSFPINLVRQIHIHVLIILLTLKYMY